MKAKRVIAADLLPSRFPWGIGAAIWLVGKEVLISDYLWMPKLLIVAIALGWAFNVMTQKQVDPKDL